jgi:hypothetical protein
MMCLMIRLDVCIFYHSIVDAAFKVFGLNGIAEWLTRYHDLQIQSNLKFRIIMTYHLVMHLGIISTSSLIP